MENKSFKILAIIALCMAVAGLSIAYAALSQSLNIKGSAKAEASATDWNVHFENGSCQTTGSAEAGTFNAVGTAATLGESTFLAPGDSIVCTFDVVNEGTINAKITNVNIESVENLTYTGTGDTKNADEELVKSNMEFSVTYADNKTIKVDDALDSNERKTLKLVLKYSENAKTLPTSEVLIDNIVGTIIYGQV